MSGDTTTCGEHDHRGGIGLLIVAEQVFRIFHIMMVSELVHACGNLNHFRCLATVLERDRTSVVQEMLMVDDGVGVSVSDEVCEVTPSIWDDQFTVLIFRQRDDVDFAGRIVDAHVWADIWDASENGSFLCCEHCELSPTQDAVEADVWAWAIPVAQQVVRDHQTP